MNAETLVALLGLKDALGGAMTTEQQVWVSAQWPELGAFLATDLGRTALHTFIQDWQAQSSSQS